EAAPALLAQICEGLHQLHHAGWVHGDLKPANVLLMADGSVRLGDFNMAAELEGTHAYAPAFGTPDYTPPALLWPEIDERGTRVRPSADIWAFGVLAHLTLTGALPLPGGTPEARADAAMRYARGREELRLSPELPDAWRELVRDCLAPEGADRPPAPPREAPPPPAAPRTPAPARRCATRAAGRTCACPPNSPTPGGRSSVTAWRPKARTGSPRKPCCAASSRPPASPDHPACPGS